jgi:uncharacterized membrane protein
MKIIDPGHRYELYFLDKTSKIVENLNILQFVKRVGKNYPGNLIPDSGTTLQECLRVCLDRVKYLNNQKKDILNFQVINYLKYIIYLLEKRAAQQHHRIIPTINEACYDNQCKFCLHVGCIGNCLTKIK